MVRGVTDEVTLTITSPLRITIAAAISVTVGELSLVTVGADPDPHNKDINHTGDTHERMGKLRNLECIPLVAER